MSDKNVEECLKKVLESKEMPDAQTDPEDN